MRFPFKPVSLIVAFIFFTSCKSNTMSIPVLSNGVFDITTFGSEIDKVYELEGELLFYYKQLPYSKDGVFQVDSLVNAEKITTFPTTWQELGYEAKGYGTFRLQLKLTGKEEELMLYIPRIESSGTVWINGIKTDEFGKFAMNQNGAVAYGKPLYIPLNNIGKSNIEVFIVTSNYHHVKGGGFPYGISLGPKDSITLSATVAEYLEGSTILVILIISLYHIFILFFTDRKYMVLYFGLLCSIACIRQLFVGEAIIYNFIPDISFHTVQLGRYLPLYFGGTFFLVYYKHLIPKQSLVQISRGIIFCFLVLAIYTLSTPIYESTYTSYVNSYIGLICLSAVLFGVTKAFFQKTHLSTPIFISTIIAIAFLINDLLLILKFVKTLFLTNYGILFFLVLQASINFRLNREANRKAKELFERVLRLEKEVQIKKQEVNSLLTESIQQLKSKQELTHKLDKIRKTGSNVDLNEIVAELKSEKLKDHRIITLKQNIEELNFKFIAAIKEKYPQLTRTDIEICSFIRLGLTSKEIANIRSNSVFSVKSSRYRIRKKIGLPKEISLTVFIKSFHAEEADIV